MTLPLSAAVERMPVALMSSTSGDVYRIGTVDRLTADHPEAGTYNDTAVLRFVVDAMTKGKWDAPPVKGEAALLLLLIHACKAQREDGVRDRAREQALMRRLIQDMGLDWLAKVQQGWGKADIRVPGADPEVKKAPSDPEAKLKDHPAVAAHYEHLSAPTSEDVFTVEVQDLGPHADLVRAVLVASGVAPCGELVFQAGASTLRLAQTTLGPTTRARAFGLEQKLCLLKAKVVVTPCSTLSQEGRESWETAQAEGEYWSIHLVGGVDPSRLEALCAALADVFSVERDTPMPPNHPRIEAVFVDLKDNGLALVRYLGSFQAALDACTRLEREGAMVALAASTRRDAGLSWPDRC